MRYGNYYGNGWGMSPGGWVLMILFWLAIFALIVVGLVFLFRMLSHPSPAHGPAVHAPRPGPPPVNPQQTSPQQILDERFARGEIDVDEYRLRGDALRAPLSDQPKPDAPPTS